MWCIVATNEQLEMFTATIGLTGAKELPAVNRNVVIVHHDAQHTSIKAAIRVLPKTGSNRMRVYESLCLHNATDEELETTLNMSGNTIRPTRGTLVKDGLIKDSGFTRHTRSGNDAIVWCVV